jgi:hypothetical protein
MTTYPRIPDPPAEDADSIADGFALLAYTIREDWAPIVSPDRLARAEQAAIVAGARRKDEHPAAVAAVTRAQRLIAGALRRALTYQAEQDAEPAPAPAPTQEPTHDGNQRTHPIPFTRPPAPAARPIPAAPVAGGRAMQF